MSLTPRQRFLKALQRQDVDRAPVANPNSLVTVELQERVGAFSPEDHLDSEIMATLAAAGRTICGYDVVQARKRALLAGQEIDEESGV